MRSALPSSLGPRGAVARVHETEHRDPDPGVSRSATIWLELKGGNALAEAGHMLAETRRRGDARATETWRRIIAAIEEIQRRMRPPER